MFQCFFEKYYHFSRAFDSEACMITVSSTRSRRPVRDECDSELVSLPCCWSSHMWRTIIVNQKHETRTLFAFAKAAFVKSRSLRSPKEMKNRTMTNQLFLPEQHKKIKYKKFISLSISLMSQSPTSKPRETTLTNQLELNWLKILSTVMMSLMIEWWGVVVWFDKLLRIRMLEWVRNVFWEPLRHIRSQLKLSWPNLWEI